MRLEEWKGIAPSPGCLSKDVLDILTPVLVALGAEPDPECWVLWGDDFEVRYSLLAPTPAGLVVAAIRLASSMEGPRVSGKLVRWSKLTVGEMSLESSGGRRIVAVQVENLVLKGTDEEADRICRFCVGLLAGIDGRAYVLAPAVSVATAPVAVPAAAAPEAPAAAPATSTKGPVKALPSPLDRAGRAAAARSLRPVGGRSSEGGSPRETSTRTSGDKAQPAWVSAHPVSPTPAQPGDGASVWDVPSGRPAPRKQPTRTWRP